MTRGALSLAADLVEAGALEVAAACEARGMDPAAGIAGVLAALRDHGGANEKETPCDR